MMGEMDCLQYHSGEALFVVLALKIGGCEDLDSRSLMSQML